MALLESTKLERLRVIRDADFVDRFEEANAEVILTPGVDESVTGGANPQFEVAFAPFASETTTEQRTGRIIDDFEDADLSEYQGDVGDIDVTVQGIVVKDGRYALQLPTGAVGSSDDTLIYSFPSDGLPIYPEPGDKFETGIYVTDFAADPVFCFGLQSSIDFYFVRLGAGEDDLAVGKLDGDVETEFDTTSVTIPEDEWITVEIAWRPDGNIEVDLKDASDTVIASVSAKDDTFGSGGIGWAEAQDFED